jgi:hypothetical protein
MEVETLITRPFHEVDIIKSSVPSTLQDVYPGRNTNIEMTEMEKMFIESAKRMITNGALEDVPSPIIEEVEDDSCSTTDEIVIVDEQPTVQIVANKMSFTAPEGAQFRIERTEASYIPTATTMPTPVFRQDYDRDKHISDLNEKIRQLESEKTSNAKRFLMKLRGEAEQDKRRRRVKIYAAEHNMPLTDEDLDSFSQKEFDFIYSAVMKAKNKNVYLLVYYAIFINSLKIANKFLAKKKTGIDIQYIIDSITSNVFIEEMEDAMPDIMSNTIDNVTQTQNPLLKLIYLIIVKPIELKLPSLLQ